MHCLGTFKNRLGVRSAGRLMGCSSHWRVWTPLITDLHGAGELCEFRQGGEGLDGDLSQLLSVLTECGKLRWSPGWLLHAITLFAAIHFVDWRNGFENKFIRQVKTQHLCPSHWLTVPSCRVPEPYFCGTKARDTLLFHQPHFELHCGGRPTPGPIQDQPLSHQLLAIPGASLSHDESFIRCCSRHVGGYLPFSFSLALFCWHLFSGVNLW